MDKENPIPADAANPQPEQSPYPPRNGYLTTAPRLSDEWTRQTIEIYEETVTHNPFIPKRILRDGKPHPKQQRFLLSAETLEIFFGGAVGGAKSSALLLAALQFVNVPGYSALLIRRTFPELTQPGALISLSKEWLAGTKAEWSQRDRRWTFPSGATITFGYLERYDDALQYQGAAFQLIGFDELSSFEEESYLYLYSRLRKPEEMLIPVRMRATSNPGGPGAAWVKKRFIDAATRPPGVLFIPSKLQDNPSLNYDEYVKSLSHLDPITRRQLLEGDWEASKDGRFKKSWFTGRWSDDRQAFHLHSAGMEVGHGILFNRCSYFVTVDLSASVKTSGDYTVFLACAVTPWNQLLVLDMERKRHPVEQIPSNLRDFCEKVERRYNMRLAWAGVEANGMQISIAAACRQLPGMVPVKYLTPGNQDKLARAQSAIIACEQGHVFLPIHAPWLDDFLFELVQFTGDSKKDAFDDVVDVLSYAVSNMSFANYEAPTIGKATEKNLHGPGHPQNSDGMSRIFRREGRIKRLFGGA